MLHSASTPERASGSYGRQIDHNNTIHTFQTLLHLSAIPIMLDITQLNFFFNRDQLFVFFGEKLNKTLTIYSRMAKLYYDLHEAEINGITPSFYFNSS